MRRDNSYTIEIFFDYNKQTSLIYSGQVPYFGSASFTDDFRIFTDKIIIKAQRSAIIPLDNIFYNHFSSLYNQILKSLLYYYASIGIFSKIKSIKISRKRSRDILEERIFKNSQFNQVLDNSYRLKYQINPDCLQELFKETPKGQTTLISVSYLLIANISSNESGKFEKLWKAFNKLYTHIANNNKDFHCLKYLRSFIKNNPNILPLSSKKVKPITTYKLRNSIRWRSMFLDNFDTESKSRNFKEFVTRYTDKRVMEILLETKYGYRETFLRNNGFFNEVKSHIQNIIASGTNNDNEVVTFLTGRYMYFVRNKTFHGEKVDSLFRLSVNKEDKEFKFLNSILEPYIIDLINANDIY